MVMVAEQLSTDYLLVAAIIFVFTSALLGSFLLASMYQQIREGGTLRTWRLLAWALPAGLISTAMWSLVMPTITALVVGAATGLAAFAGLALLPYGPWEATGPAPSRWRAGGLSYAPTPSPPVAERVWKVAVAFLGNSLWGLLRMGLMLAPAVWIGGAPAWLMWFSLVGVGVAAVHVASLHAGPNHPGLGKAAERAEISWGAAQGFVLGGLPALLLVMS
jgi:hypothetical protein